MVKGAITDAGVTYLDSFARYDNVPAGQEGVITIPLPDGSSRRLRRSQSEQAQEGDQGEVVQIGRQPGGGDQGNPADGAADADDRPRQSRLHECAVGRSTG
jgi:hypothetical protein